MTSPDQHPLFAELPILVEVGAELERILEADVAPARRLRWTALGNRGRRWRGAPPFALFAVLVFGGTAGALAATGLLSASPVRPTSPVIASAGLGVPLAGQSRLLSLRVADPSGGLPWGMRVVRTTRGEICVQVGRIDRGQLGQLGIDGAFRDDGRFHPLPPDVLGPATGGLGGVFQNCVTLGSTYAHFSVGGEANAANELPATKGRPSEGRDLSFGLLGPNAKSITYRSGSRTLTERVLPALGAYLIVASYTTGSTPPGFGSCGSCVGSTGGSLGDDAGYPQSNPVSPAGALTAITYRYAGKNCVDNASAGDGLPGVSHYNDQILRFRRSCGLSEVPRPRPVLLPSAREPLRVHLAISGHLITGATITFKAPIAVTSAAQAYQAWARVDGQLTGLALTSRNVARGAAVRVGIMELLAQAAARTVTIEVEYSQGLLGMPGQHAVVGTVTIREPASSTWPAEPPRPQTRSPRHIIAAH